MQKRSLADAKSHLSELVDAAEHRGKRTLILRHGKPAAVLAPVKDVLRKDRKRILSDEEVRRGVREFIEEFSSAEPERSAVEDLLKGRR